MNLWYARKTPEERAAWVAKRSQSISQKNDRARYYRDRSKRRKAAQEYRANNPQLFLEACAAWAMRNPHKKKAHNAVSNAIRDGRLIKGPCENADEDCTATITAHHPDYSKPLQVIWLCTFHHGVRHRRYLDSISKAIAK